MRHEPPGVPLRSQELTNRMPGVLRLGWEPHAAELEPGHARLSPSLSLLRASGASLSETAPKHRRSGGDKRDHRGGSRRLTSAATASGVMPKCANRA